MQSEFLEDSGVEPRYSSRGQFYCIDKLVNSNLFDCGMCCSDYAPYVIAASWDRKWGGFVLWILVRSGVHGCERKRWGQEVETIQQEMLLSLVAAIFIGLCQDLAESKAIFKQEHCF